MPESTPNIKSRRKGELILASDQQSLARAVNSLSQSLAPAPTGHGNAYYGREALSPYDLTFASGWTVKIEPGSIIEINNDVAGTISPILPVDIEIDGDPMDTDPRPKITVEDGDDVYLIIETDSNGGITGNPYIQVDEGEDMTSHLDSLVGLYKVLLFSVNLAPGSGSRLEISAVHQKGNLYWQNQPIPTHPFKVTDAGAGSVDIEAGFINGYYMYYEDTGIFEDPNTFSGPSSIVKGPAAEYFGGSKAITGTKYLYAETTRNGPTNEYCHTTDSSAITSKLYDDIEPAGFTTGSPTESVSIVVSTEDPEAYSVSTSDTNAAVCIAKIVNDGADLLTITQYITHDPDLFIPVIELTASHPWKVASNGDGTVAVSAGSVSRWETEGASSEQQAFYNQVKAAEFTGGDVTVTGTGVIYGMIGLTVGDTISHSDLADETITNNYIVPSGSITVHYGASVPSSGTDKIHFEIADVSLVSTIAVVDDQILTHNPNLSSNIISNNE